MGTDMRKIKYRRCLNKSHHDLLPATLEYFPKAGELDKLNYRICQVTGLGPICIKCRRGYNRLEGKNVIWQEALNFWSEYHYSKFWQTYDLYIPGLSNFDRHINPVPIVTHTLLSKLHPQRWSIYALVYQFYFVYPTLKIKCPYPEFGQSFLLANPHDLTKAVPDNRLVDPSTQIQSGFNLITSKVRMARQFAHLLTPYKVCKQCKQSLRTFSRADDFDYMAELLAKYLAGKKPYIKPENFDRSYQSRDGWKTLCKDCHSFSPEMP